ncbi:hypothetical protein H5U35_02060, partial [Candidatus Aerophobetes bacterium]|nr:hypothetical protein [Candidatus Aerophobetes bacterium]
MHQDKIIQTFIRKFGKDFKIYSESFKKVAGSFVFAARKKEERFLVVAENSSSFGFEADFLGKLVLEGDEFTLKLAKANSANLRILKEIFPHLSPKVCGLRKSFGTGDRLGVATSSHIAAFEGKDFFPVLAQQSVRENMRTGRDFGKVLEDVIWGCFQAGYEGEFGADADHVKKIEDLKEAAECGYTMFTIDLSDFIKEDTLTLSPQEKGKLCRNLPQLKEVEKIYLGRKYKIGKEEFNFTEDLLVEVFLVYSKAIQHAAFCYRFLKDQKREFDFEISVDETSLPTSPLAHIFIAEELHRKGVEFQNLALRFCGEWQKGIDYIGDVKKFEREVNIHAGIAKNLGGYKLSLHSGSDKFSVYPVFAKATGEKFHVKTSGTTYLEEIKLIAEKAPSLYRKIHKLALKKFDQDKAFYHVTCDISRIPSLDELSDDELPGLFNLPDCRQLIHFSFVSVLGAIDEEGGLLRVKFIYVLLGLVIEDCYKISSHILKLLEL